MKVQSNHQTDSIDSAHLPRDHENQTATPHRRHLDRLFETPATLKTTHLDPRRTDAYISDIINVQSLLNIRSAPLRRVKRATSKTFDDRIIINVCGDRYETHRTTLELYPDTLLGDRKQRKYYYDKTRNEYFFDRNRACFEAILYYYQSHGRLRRPNFVSIDIFLEEVTFFRLGQKALEQLREDENIKEVKKVRLPKSRCRRYLWATMEYPDYSLLAKIVNILSLLMILISTVSLAIESLPQFANLVQLECKHDLESTLNLYSNDTNKTTNQHSSNDNHICRRYFSSPFFIIQTICISFFTLELFLRIISAPSLFDFVKTLMNWVDIIAVVTYYISIAIYLTGRQNDVNSSTYVGLRLIRILRFSRVFKFYRIFKSIKSLRVLSSTMKQSIPDFFIMIIILTLLSFLFGAAAYFAEYDTNGQAFDSILKATYWGIITITSVGYGDIYPITPVGRIIACLCSLVGAAMIGMLVSVLVDRYQRVFARKLYINEETIDFADYSDDEMNDTDSRSFGTGQLRRRNIGKDIEDPDARARANTAFVPDDNDIPDTPEVILPLEEQLIKEIPLSRHSSRVHFIIGYVDDQTREASRNLLDTISSVVTQKQTAGDNIQLNIVADDQQPLAEIPPDNVKFRVSISSNEDLDDDDDEELTEINSGSRNKGNVLKKFQHPPSPETNQHFTKSEKRV